MDVPPQSGAGNPLLEDEDFDLEAVPGATPPVMPKPVAVAATHGRPVLELLMSCVGCCGIVFGDLGTSPIYAFREAFASRAFEATQENVLGVLSMIIYALIMVVSCKYLMLLCYVEGPGGTGGSLALIRALSASIPSARPLLVAAGMLAISLFLADSLVTPGVSVLSAVEGLVSLAPQFEPFCPIIAIAILGLLFFSQRYGPGSLGKLFGPFMVCFFLTIGTLGLTTIALSGQWIVFASLNPLASLAFAWRHPYGAWIALQSVILAVTGAEALYSDMAIFGRKPIQLTWASLIFVSLVLCYCGQGAVLLDPAFLPELQRNPFFALAPNAWIRSALVAVSTGATLIASQSVVSGAFAVVDEACVFFLVMMISRCPVLTMACRIALGLCPRLAVVRTSHTEHGQIYVPALNAFLGFGCVALVGLFRRSTALASAYGLAVCGAMLVDTWMLIPVLHTVFQWRLPFAVGLFSIYLVSDTLFFAAGLSKFFSGAWLPLGLSVLFVFVLATWTRGRRLSMRAAQEDEAPPTAALAAAWRGPRPPGVGVFLTRTPERAPYALVAMQRHCGGPAHATVVALHLHVDHYATERRPLACLLTDLGDGVWIADAHWDGVGAFDLAGALRAQLPDALDEQTTFYLHREMPVARHMSEWRASVYAVLLEIGRGTLCKMLRGDRTVELVKRVHV